jgi:hypothetical protein
MSGVVWKHPLIKSIYIAKGKKKKKKKEITVLVKATKIMQAWQYGGRDKDGTKGDIVLIPTALQRVRKFRNS